MHEQLDDELKKRIASVFENYEDAGANEGWLILREKFPAEKRGSLPWLWLGAAAGLLLFLGVGLWFYNNQQVTSQMAGKRTKDSLTNDLIANQKNKPSERENTVTNPAHKNAASGQTNPYSIKSNSQNHPSNNEELLTTTVTSVKKIKAKRASLNSDASTRSVKTPDERIAVKRAQNEGSKPLADKDERVVTIHKAHYIKSHVSSVAGQDQIFATTAANSRKHDKKSNNIDEVAVGDAQQGDQDMAENKTPISSKIIKEQPAVLAVKYKSFSIDLGVTAVTINQSLIKTDAPKTAIYTMFAADNRKPEEEITGRGKKVEFGVYEATYLNYAKGSDNQVNVGAGVSSDIYLTQNLKLITGISIGKNSLSYAGNSMYNVVQSDNVPTAAISAASALYSAAYFTPATILRTYNAGLIDLDIPVNLKYEFNPQKNNLYISAGLSSGTFISESYNYQYGYQAASVAYPQQPAGSSTNKNFSSFYFAKTLNFALGAGLPFGRNRLIFEPFLKYPIGGLGSQDIAFGSMGLNLRFRFQ